MGVCFAFPTYDGRLPVEASVSLANTVAQLREAKIPVGMQWGSESALIDLCRSRLVKVFLEQTKYKKLIFIDSDIVFKPDDVMRLLLHSVKYPVVGAVYPRRKDPPAFYLKAKDSKLETNEDGLIEVLGFGAGFVIIDRSVFGIMEQYVSEVDTDRDVNLKMFFDIRILGREYCGEDISFYKRWVEDCKGKVYLDPYINLKHLGSRSFDYKFIEHLDKTLGRVDSRL